MLDPHQADLFVANLVSVFSEAIDAKEAEISAECHLAARWAINHILEILKAHLPDGIRSQLQAFSVAYGQIPTDDVLSRGMASINVLIDHAKLIEASQGGGAS